MYQIGDFRRAGLLLGLAILLVLLGRSDLGLLFPCDLFGVLFAIAGTYAGLGSILGTGKGDARAAVTSAPSFRIYAFFALFQIPLSAWSGRSIQTGPDVMGAALLPTAFDLIVVVLAIRIGVLLASEWSRVSWVQRIAGVIAVLTSVPVLLVANHIFVNRGHF